MIRFGIISFAHMHANDYARALQSLSALGQAELVAIADPDAARGNARAAEFNVSHVFTDYTAMLKEDIVDAVIIASENVHHLEQVRAFAAAGKHIICEKPLSISMQDLQDMEKIVRESGRSVHFQTAFVMRYDATVRQAKRQLDGGTLGAIKAISATNHGTYPGGWFGEKNLSGGGAIIDHTVHVADLIRHFTGEEFGCVRAFQGKNIRPLIAVEDNAMLYCRLRSGTPVSIDCSWSRTDGWPVWGDVTMNIVCEQGMLKLDCFRPHLNVVSKGKFGWHGLGEDLNLKMIQSFCEAVRDDREPSASFRDGAQAARVALAAYQSLAEESREISV